MSLGKDTVSHGKDGKMKNPTTISEQSCVKNADPNVF
jgi:hypothetical protein